MLNLRFTKAKKTLKAILEMSLQQPKEINSL